eukprot:jgi/Botrbrau1/4785/Bobra.0325s0007.2
MMVNDGQPVRMSDVVNGFAAGAISSLLSRSLTYPLDTIKSQLQMESAADHSSPRAALRLVRQVAASEGVPGFYRGFGAVLVGSIPGSMAYFGAFEMAKVLLPADSGLAGGLATGAFAQLLGGLVFTPMDIIKERLQCRPSDRCGACTRTGAAGTLSRMPGRVGACPPYSEATGSPIRFGFPGACCTRLFTGRPRRRRPCGWGVRKRNCLRLPSWLRQRGPQALPGS